MSAASCGPTRGAHWTRWSTTTATTSRSSGRTSRCAGCWRRWASVRLATAGKRADVARGDEPQLISRRGLAIDAYGCLERGGGELHAGCDLLGRGRGRLGVGQRRSLAEQEKQQKDAQRQASHDAGL